LIIFPAVEIGVEDTAAGGAAVVEDRGSVGSVDAEMVIGLAARAGQAIGMEQADELVVAGVLVHEVDQGEVHGGVSRVGMGFHRMIPQILEQPGEVAHRFRLMSQSLFLVPERLREALRQLFAVIHRREELPDAVFRGQLETARAEVMRRGTRDVPEAKHGRNLAKRFEAHGESYFRFVTEPGVEPTNNLAEQAIRFVVIDRLITQGTRSESGNRWCERIWTVIATCAQQGRSVFAYLEAAVGAWFEGTEAPSLLPGG
jgi:hypothetical protein